jgi:PAS domain-containing protein
VFKYRFLAVTLLRVAEDILSHISDMVMRLDSRQTIIMANRTVDELLSIKPETLKGSYFDKIVRTGEDIEKKLTDFINGAAAYFQSRLVYEKEGTESLVTETYFSKVSDAFSDIVGNLVISKEIKRRKEFQHAHRIRARKKGRTGK